MRRRYPIWLDYDSARPAGWAVIDEDDVPTEALVRCALVPAIKHHQDSEVPDGVTGFGLVLRERVDTRPLKEIKRANRP